MTQDAAAISSHPLFCTEAATADTALHKDIQHLNTAKATAISAAATVPIHNLQLSSQEPLFAATRKLCPNCNKTRAFFCYDCLTPLMDGIPSIPNLPINIHIVMHGETNAQATGTHAAVIAPIKLFRHNDGTSHHRRQAASKLQLPDWDPATTAVLYPEGPDTPVVGLWGRLEIPGQQQKHQTQQEQQQEQQKHKQQGKQGTAVTGDEEEDSSRSKEGNGKHCGACRCQDLQQGLGQIVQQLTLAGDIAQQQQHTSRPQCCGHHGRSSALSCGCTSPCCPNLSTAGTASHVESSKSSASSFPYTTVVVLEGNWAKARSLLQHPKIAVLPRVQLPLNVRSLFWRRGTGSFRAAVDCGVCTIEAIYLLLRQLQPEPAHKWDDLLWFFSYQRQLVQQMGSHQTRQEMQQNYEIACGSGRSLSAS